MTEQEFVEQWAALSKKTVQEVRRCFVPLPCDCGGAGCQGWKMAGGSLVDFWDSDYPRFPCDPRPLTEPEDPC